MGIVWHQARLHAENRNRTLNVYLPCCKHDLQPYMDSRCIWTKTLNFTDMNSVAQELLYNMF